MAPNVTVSFWAANDINGTPLLTITDEDTFFKGLTLTPDLYSLGGWELTLSRAWGFELFGSGATEAEVFVRFMVHAFSDTTWFYGGVLNKRDLTVVHRQEIGAEDYVIGGTGPKQYMDRSALGIEERTGLGFNLDLPNGVWRWNEAATAGRVLDTVVDEDSARSNPSLPDATYNFNATNDSDGNPWTEEVTPGAGEYQTPIGSSLLDVIFDLEDLTELFTTVHLGTLASPQYQLNAFQSFGDDNSGSAFGPGVGLLREGVNIANEALHVQGVGFRKASHVIVEGKDHVWVTEVRPTWSPGDYVKWDKINYSRSSSETILHRAGERWLQRQNNGDQQLTVEIVPGNSPNTGYYFPAPNDPIWLGNTISLDTVADGSVHSPLDYNNAAQLVTGLELSLGDAGDNSTADREAKSWDVKVRLNWERAGHAAAPDQQSASTITCRCQGGNHPPPPCIPPTPDSVLSSSTDTPSDWPGTNVTTGSCWGGGAHMTMGASGGESDQISVSAGDIITGSITFKEETGNNSWENNSNYAYVAFLKLEGPGQPVLEYTIVNQLYHHTGCIDVTHEETVTVPSGYTTARIRFRFKLGGIRYIAEITESAEAPPDIPFCVDPTLPADSPYSYPSDTVDALIEQEIANAKVGTVRRYMRNNSGGVLEVGDLVIPDTATLDGVTTTTSDHQQASPVGVVTEGGSDQEQVLVVWFGPIATLNTPDTAVAGDYVYTSTVAGEADLSATREAGAVGQVAEDAGDLVVYLWGVPDAGSSTPPVTDHGDLTGLPDNDHPQYRLTTDGGQDVVEVHSAAGSTETLDLAAGNVHDVTLTADCTLTLAGATAGVECSMSVLLRQGTGAPWTVTWPGSVEWVGGTAPVLETAEDAWNWVSLTTLDGGTVWFADGGAGSLELSDAIPLVESGTGSAGDDTEASRADHVHPAASAGEILISDTPSTPLIFADLIQNESQDDLVYADV